MLLAQPAQLPLWQSELAAPWPHIAQTLARAAGAGSRGHWGTRPGPFRAELSESEFLAWRVRENWKSPQRAFVLSVLYWFFVLFPTLAGRFLALSALREYERARWQAVRQQIQNEGNSAAQRVRAQLERFPSYLTPFHSSLASPFESSVPFLARPPSSRFSEIRNRALRRACRQEAGACPGQVMRQWFRGQLEAHYEGYPAPIRAQPRTCVDSPTSSASTGHTYVSSSCSTRLQEGKTRKLTCSTRHASNMLGSRISTSEASASRGPS